MGSETVPEMVERVARTIDPGAWCRGPSATLALLCRPEREARRAASIRKARRAIAVMGRPSAEMRQATFLKYVYGEGERIEYWRGMLRIALKPEARLDR